MGALQPESILEPEVERWGWLAPGPSKGGVGQVCGENVSAV